jgi:hypothetical protein
MGTFSNKIGVMLGGIGRSVAVAVAVEVEVAVSGVRLGLATTSVGGAGVVVAVGGGVGVAGRGVEVTSTTTVTTLGVSWTAVATWLQPVSTSPSNTIHRNKFRLKGFLSIVKSLFQLSEG